MDRAIEYSVGKNKTVKAAELEKTIKNTISASSKRFICSECGEYITFVRRDKFKSYFKHGNNTENSKICDLRIDVRNDQSIYERMGLPLYLKKTDEPKFELNVGFHKLDEMLMNIAEDIGLNVSIKLINGDNKFSVPYIVNYNNFSISSITFKKIDFISTRYLLQYSSSKAEQEQLLSKRWGKEFEGILSGGALFTFNDNGGRKIKINEEIKTDTDYFYLCKNENILDKFDIQHFYCGELSLKLSIYSETYKIYKIKFNATSDSQFKKLFNFCRDFLKISLVYKPLTLIAMWPPSIQIDNQISYLDRNKALFILESEETNARVFIYKENKSNELKGEHIKNNKYLIRMPIFNDEVAININEKYNSVYALLSYYKKNIKTYNNKICMKDINDNPILEGDGMKLPIKKLIKITSETKCDILHIRNFQFYKSYKITSEIGVTIDNIAFGDEIFCINGMEQISLLKFAKNQIQSDQIINDELLYLNLRQIGSPFISTPMWVKPLLGSLKSNSKSFKVIKSYLYTNNMPVNAYRILKDLYLTMKVGVDYE